MKIDTKARAYVSGMTLHLGVFGCNGYLLPILSPDVSVKVKMCTPTGEPVQQQYVDTDGTVWGRDDLCRMFESIGEIVTAESIKGAKAESECPANVLNLTVHDRNQAAPTMFPSDDNAYVFIPGSRTEKKIDKRNEDIYQFILTAASECTDKVLLGVARIRAGKESLYSLVLWRGHLVLQRQNWPANLWDYEQNPIHPHQGVERDKVLAMVKRMETAYDPTTYQDQSVQRVRALAPIEGIEAPAPKIVKDFDLMAELDALLGEDA